MLDLSTSGAIPRPVPNPLRPHRREEPRMITITPVARERIHGFMQAENRPGLALRFACHITVSLPSYYPFHL